MRSWGPIAIVAVVLVGAGLFVSGLVFNASRNKGANPDLLATVLAIRPDDHVRGPATSTVTIVEYSDFQCPACRTYGGIIRQLEREGVPFRLVYRHFPLREKHIHADIAARAAEAAAIQDPQAFWGMHDLIFENQDLWEDNTETQMRNTLLSYPRIVLKLDVEQFERDLESDPVRDRISRDLADGRLLGVNATPTFFVNGKRIQNPPSFQDFRTLIESAGE